jgi:hypothetical protein
MKLTLWPNQVAEANPDGRFRSIEYAGCVPPHWFRVVQHWSLDNYAHFMSDIIIPNTKDRHFNSMLKKLNSAGWISDKVYLLPKTKDRLGNLSFVWTEKGQFLALTYKAGLTNHHLWDEASSFVRTLNEQEEAFFHMILLATVSDNPPNS